MAVLFIEPGTDATFDLSFYTSVTGTVTSDSGQAQTGPRSLKFDTGAGPSFASVNLTSVPSVSRGVISLAVRIPTLPAVTAQLLSVVTASGSFQLIVTSTGATRFTNGGTGLGSLGTPLSTSTWTHLAICYTITSTTVNDLRLFVGTASSPDLTLTNATLGAGGTAALALGPGTPVGGSANFVVNIDDVYVDDTGTLANPGDIRVSAKRPTSLYEGGFDTAIGANPSDRWTNVNERALSETNGWAQSAPLQYARPASDITTTGWTVFGGGPTQANRTSPEPKVSSFEGQVYGGRRPQTTRIWRGSRPSFAGRVIQSAPRPVYSAMSQGVRDATADDDMSYVQRASTGTLEVKLNALTDPAVSTDHVLSCRLQCTDGTGAGEKATLSLVQATTIIASAPQITLTRGSYATITYPLTSAEANAITDYSDLRLRLVVDTAAAGEHTRITQMFFQAPQALANCPNETYQLERWAAGDVDLSGATLVGRSAWAWVKKTASTIAGEGLWADGALTTATFGTTSALVTVTDGLDKYPTADRGIGVRASSGDAVTSLSECGYLLAFLPVTTTRLYLRLINNPTVPTPGGKSTALPSGTLLDTAPLEQTLALTRGLAETSLAWSTLGQTGAQSDYVGRFTSPGLNAVTIAANTWTVTFVAVEGGANANAFLALSLYVWRHSTNAVVGSIYDSATALGTEWATTRAYQTATFSGGAVTAADGDVLVLEVWQTATQGDTTAYSEAFYYEGGTGASATDAAPYLETPQVLSFGVGSAGSASLVLRNQAAPQSPSANSKSLVLPAGTFAVTAGGTPNERLTAGLLAGSGQVGVTWSSLAQTAQQSAYLTRFTSPALLAQTINAGTWTIAFAAAAGSASAASKIALSLFVWRPSTAAVLGRLYDAAAGLGTAWQTTESGVVATFTGTALAVATGDLLVLEVWQVAAQSVATAFSNSFFFEGLTPPTQGVATTNAGSVLTAPQTLNFQTYAPLGARVFALPIKERDDG